MTTARTISAQFLEHPCSHTEVDISIMFIDDFPDELFENILERDHTRHSAVFVDYDGQVFAVFLKVAEQHIQADRVGHEADLVGEIPQWFLPLAFRQRGEHVGG